MTKIGDNRWIININSTKYCYVIILSGSITNNMIHIQHDLSILMLSQIHELKRGDGFEIEQSKYLCPKFFEDNMVHQSETIVNITCFGIVYRLFMAHCKIEKNNIPKNLLRKTKVRRVIAQEAIVDFFLFI